MDILLEDVLFVARTVYGEARGEDYIGKKAVAHVIINRTNQRVGDRDHNLASTALRWRQFSAWNENDSNRKNIMGVTMASALYRECVRAVLEAIDEEDFTNGADHYYAKWIQAPYWVRSHRPVFEHGQHKFYRLNA